MSTEQALRDALRNLIEAEYRDDDDPVLHAARRQADAAPAEEAREPVAWFAFGDSNGPVPLELYGWDEKACKNAVLTYARAGNYKGTVEGYLMQQGWTLRPVYLASHAVASVDEGAREGWKLVPLEPTQSMVDAADDLYEEEREHFTETRTPGETFHGPVAAAYYRAMLAAAPSASSTDAPTGGGQAA